MTTGRLHTMRYEAGQTVNDRYGHSAGDAVLVQLAEALSSVLRRGDSAYRLGGDEFVVLLPDTDVQAVDALAGKLLLPPRPRQPSVDIVHISWHQVQVFRGHHAETAVMT